MQTKPYSIVFMGTPSYAVLTLKAICEDPRFEVRGVVTQSDKELGRGLKLEASPVKVFAQEHGLTVFSPHKLNTPEMLEALRNLSPDFFLTIAYGKILRPAFLQIPRLAPLNLHASLLPKHRGAAPIAWSIIHQEQQTGVSLMQMDAGMDTGPVYAQKILPIADDDTALSLHDKLSVLSADILLEHIDAIATGTLLAQPQVGSPSLAPTLNKQMGAIHFEQSSQSLSCLIRGLTPWPSAYVRFRNKRITLGAVLSIERNHDHVPGTFLGLEDNALLIACAQGILGVRSLKVEGKALMEAKSFINGYRLQTGDRFENFNDTK